MSATTAATVVEVEPGSTRFADFVALLNALELEDAGPGGIVRTVETVALAWHRPTSHGVGYVALDPQSGAAVGMLSTSASQRDNTHLFDFELFVEPEHRGRGHGRALLDAITARARAEGRDTLVTATSRHVPPAEAWSLHEAAVAEPALSTRLDPDEDLPGVRFARAAGFVQVQTAVRSEVRLPHDEALVAATEAEAAAHAGGYRTVSWRGRPAPELLPDLAYLEHRMSTDAPTGDMDYREEHWDADRMAALYDHHDRRGGIPIGAGAVDESTGRLVAFSEVIVDPRIGSPAFQGDTIVLQEHRGRRLGMVVKTANLRAVSAAFPEIDRVMTFNALENGPMLRVNRAIGFEPTVLYPVWQRKL